MKGTLENFNRAMDLVREQKYEEARKLYPLMLKSDAKLIEWRILERELKERPSD